MRGPQLAAPYIGLGIVLGAGIGVATGNLAVGVGLGVALGVLTGAIAARKAAPRPENPCGIVRDEERGP